jgi:hypothetical protein
MTFRNDEHEIKSRLREYLALKGVRFDAGGLFLCPFHNDRKPTMGIVPEAGGADGVNARCFSCGETADIFKFAALYEGLDARADFPEIKRRVKRALGIADASAPPPVKKSPPENNIAAVKPPVALETDAARKIYSGENLKRLALFSPAVKDALADKNNIKIERVYPYKNAAGLVEFADVRFSGESFTDGKKCVRTFWYNGSSLRMKSPPHALFNRDVLASNPALPVLVVEGAKCADAAAAIPGFVPTCWNCGAQGQKNVDFTPLKGRRVYIYPDDDPPQKKSAGNPEGLPVGRLSALKTAALLEGTASSVTIVDPLPQARKITERGADIVEALAVKSPAEIAGYIAAFTPPAPATAGDTDGPLAEFSSYFIERGIFRFHKNDDVYLIDTLNGNKTYSRTAFRDCHPATGVYCDDMKTHQVMAFLPHRDKNYPVYNIKYGYAWPPGFRGWALDGDGAEEPVINLWKGFRFYNKSETAPSPETLKKLELLQAHLFEVISGGDRNILEYLVRWLAHIFRRPAEKPGVALFAHSASQGTGKSLIFEVLMQRLIGEAAGVLNDKAFVADKFNSWMFDNIYAVLSEDSFYGQADKLKSAITETRIKRRDMHKELKNDLSFVRVVICSNKESAIFLEKTDRRFFVFEVSDVKQKLPPEERTAYFDALADAVHDDGVCAEFSRFLLNVDLTGWKPQNYPVTAKKTEMTEADMPPAAAFFDEVMNGNIRNCELKECRDIYATPTTELYYPDKLPVYHDIAREFPGCRYIERGLVLERFHEYTRNYKYTGNRFSRSVTAYFGDKVIFWNKLYRVNERVLRADFLIVRD